MNRRDVLKTLGVGAVAATGATALATSGGQGVVQAREGERGMQNVATTTQDGTFQYIGAKADSRVEWENQDKQVTHYVLRHAVKLGIGDDPDGPYWIARGSNSIHDANDDVSLFEGESGTSGFMYYPLGYAQGYHWRIIQAEGYETSKLPDDPAPAARLFERDDGATKRTRCRLTYQWQGYCGDPEKDGDRVFTEACPVDFTVEVTNDPNPVVRCVTGERDETFIIG